MVDAVGETLIDVPVPITLLAQEPSYQFHCAPRPNVPPFTVRVVFPPTQKLLFVAVASFFFACPLHAQNAFFKRGRTPTPARTLRLHYSLHGCTIQRSYTSNRDTLTYSYIHSGYSVSYYSFFRRTKQKPPVLVFFRFDYLKSAI